MQVIQKPRLNEVMERAATKLPLQFIVAMIQLLSLPSAPKQEGRDYKSSASERQGRSSSCLPPFSETDWQAVEFFVNKRDKKVGPLVCIYHYCAIVLKYYLLNIIFIYIIDILVYTISECSRSHMYNLTVLNIIL